MAYKVRIIETSSRVIEVVANDVYDAIDLASMAYNDEEIVLDFDYVDYVIEED